MYIIQGLRRIFYLICQVFFEKKSKKMSRHFHYNICSKDSYFLILMTLAMVGEIGWNSMAKITEPLINAVMMNKLKLLKGLTQNGNTIG